MLKDFLIGFEFEFGCNLTRRQLTDKMKENNWSLKGKVSEKWKITEDSSVATSMKYDYEVISPPMCGKHAITTMMDFFDLMADINAETNITCGLHINISFKDKILTTKLDMLEYLLSIDDQKLTRKYRRYDNKYCVTTDSFFKKNLSISVSDIPQTITEKLKFVEDHYIKNSPKYQTINTRRWSKKKYIEFRFVGNADYHKLPHSISTDIKHLTRIMMTCTKPKVKPNKIKVLDSFDFKYRKKGKIKPSMLHLETYYTDDFYYQNDIGSYINDDPIYYRDI